MRSPSLAILLLLVAAALGATPPAALAAPPKHPRGAKASGPWRTHGRSLHGVGRFRAKRPRPAAKPQRPRPAPAPATALRPSPPAAPATPAPVAIAAAPSTTPTPLPSEPAPTPAPDPRPFARSSFWNTPLPDSAPLDPRSDVYVADLRRQLNRWVPWINYDRFSTPVYTVPANQRTERVALDNNQPQLQAAWEHVPVPGDARPAAGSDGHMVIWQPSTDTMWEFWQARRADDGWHARWGGYMPNVSTNPGYYSDPPGWGSTATSLPVLGGLMRIDELRAGHIDHALALAVPEASSRTYSWPAQRTDGTNASPTAIPEGLRMRIDPDLDLDSVPMSPLVREMAEAAQRYGVVVRDTSGSVTFYGEDPTPSGTDPYGQVGGFLEQRYSSELLSQFPWAHLQALQTELHPA